MKCVLDSSALLAVMFAEPGAEIVESFLDEACMSSVNLIEVLHRMVDRGAPFDDAREEIDKLDVYYIDLSVPDAIEAARLRALTKRQGLSLGDRVCLSLAKRLTLPVLTTDRIWGDLDIGIDIRVIR